MARGINRVTIIGNLGADPELRHTGGGTAVTTLNVATSESWVDKQSGEKVEKTEWHRVKAFGKLAEICGEYLKKGRQVYIEGSLRTDKYTDKQGVERYSTDIIASEMQMLGSNEGGSQRQSSPARQDSRQAPSRQDHNDYAQHDKHADASNGFVDDEIPFAPINRRQLW